MATITIKIDTRSKDAPSLITYLKSLSFVKIEEDYNAETKKAIKDAKSGKVEKISLKEFRKQLYQ